MKTAEEIWNDSVMVRTDEMNRRIEAAVLAEREACAKVCDEEALAWHEGLEAEITAAKFCAAAIRARGQ